jgi:NitT/TauT family transport system ATP-binding protein
MTIDEPQPRDEGFRDSARFAAYCRELSTWLAEASLPQASRDSGEAVARGAS